MIDHVAFLSSTGSLKFPTSEVPSNPPRYVEATEELLTFTRGATSLVDRHAARWPTLRKELWRTLIAGGNRKTEPFEGILSEVFEDLTVFLDAMKSRTFPQFLRALSHQAKNRLQAWNDKLFLQCMGQYIESMTNVCRGRQFGISEHGRMCLCPPLVSAGSAIFVAHGAQLPFIVREVTHVHDCRVYELIGEAYVEGTVMRELLNSSCEESTIQII